MHFSIFDLKKLELIDLIRKVHSVSRTQSSGSTSYETVQNKN